MSPHRGGEGKDRLAVESKYRETLQTADVNGCGRDSHEAKNKQGNPGLGQSSISSGNKSSGGHATEVLVRV